MYIHANYCFTKELGGIIEMNNYHNTTSSMKRDSQVQLMQLRLNSIREKYHYSWEKLDPDGIYGPKTKKVVLAFQKNRGISPASDRLDSKIMKLIVDADTPKILTSDADLDNYYDAVKEGTKAFYDVTSRSIQTAYKVDGFFNPNEKGIARIFAEWERMIIHQRDGLLRRLSKLPYKKQMRLRNVIKQLESCKKFVNKAKKYGINTAIVELGTNLTKTDAIKYIKEMGELIDKSTLTKSVRFFTWSFDKIKKIISPIIDVLNKIPGLKYLSVIEKLVKATYNMFQCDFEDAFKLYLDALRELLEQILIDAVVVAAIAAGGWIALVLAIVVVIGAMVIDYFFFSDNPGDSIADKHFNVRTQNIVQDEFAPWAYHLVNE